MPCKKTRKISQTVKPNRLDTFYILSMKIQLISICKYCIVHN